MEGRVDEIYSEGRMLVYRGGGCKHPDHRCIRRAAYGVYYGKHHKWNVATPLVGRVQTVPRAELRALACALEWASEPIEVVLDNEWTVKGAQSVLAGGGHSSMSHADLWKRAHAEIGRLGK